MAAGRYFEFRKNLNNFRTIYPILTKLGMELCHATAQTTEGSKISCSKYKMAADENSNFGCRRISRFIPFSTLQFVPVSIIRLHQ
jgi:hypothetical protein